jgi:hypothetical protein
MTNAAGDRHRFDALAPSFGASTASDSYVVLSVPASPTRTWTGIGFQRSTGCTTGFESSTVRRTRPAALQRLQGVLRGMATHQTDAGAVEQLTAEINSLSAARARATSAMLDDAE